MLMRLFTLVGPPLGLTCRVLRWAVLPAVLLIALSLASGLVRATALGAFVLVVLLRGAMVAVERLGDNVPSPRLSREVR